MSEKILTISVTAMATFASVIVGEGGNIVDLAGKYGALVGLIIWFAWRDSTREQQMVKRIRELENRQTRQMGELIEASNNAITLNSECLKQLCATVERCQQKVPN